ncbi:MAG: isoprenyl transferase [Saprospiraceae bacterium]|nr:isoprenyl transferase [Saprospiraceae bacterium]
MSLKTEIDLNNLPKHVAVIMDGNGRWAKERSRPRVFGHSNGVKSVRDITECAAELGVSYLTLYAFSTENWKRPATEVNTLMKLFVQTVKKELKTLNNNNIRLKAIGNLKNLPKDTYESLIYGMKSTENNTRMTLTLALNYSARWEIVDAVNQVMNDANKYPEGVSHDQFESYLQTAHMPDPELMIRTSGEHRISNYLLWQLAYSELYFTDVLWPDFTKDDFYKAILSYQSRERRFGKTGEQLKK